MTFVKGISGNPAGKKPGTLNKSTELKNALVALVKAKLDSGELAKTVSNKDLLKAIAGLLPREQTVSMETTPISIQVNTCEQPVETVDKTSGSDDPDAEK
tara:strand:+ start:762 stop:1061 length:300 start_codon:yes stop_codon:yes gene_type:complete